VLFGVVTEAPPVPVVLLLDDEPVPVAAMGQCQKWVGSFDHLIAHGGRSRLSGRPFKLR